MRKAWLGSVVSAAGLAALGAGSTGASASVTGFLPSTANSAHHSTEITKVNHRYWRYGPTYYSGDYYSAPYGYVYPPAAYYAPPVTYYVVPAPRYVPYYPYDGYYARPYRSCYYYGGW